MSETPAPCRKCRSIEIAPIYENNGFNEPGAEMVEMIGVKCNNCGYQDYD